MRLNSVLATSAICLVLAGCIPKADQPLSDVQSAEADQRLVGVWTMTDANGNTAYLHIGREFERPVTPGAVEPEPGLMRLWLLNNEANTRRVSWPLGVRFYTTRLGGDTYANLIMPFETAKEPITDPSPDAYLIAKYVVQGDQLKFWFMGWEATAKAIESGKLDGFVRREGDQLKDVRITSPREDLVKFLQGDGNRLVFPEGNEQTYRRLQ